MRCLTTSNGSIIDRNILSDRHDPLYAAGPYRFVKQMDLALLFLHAVINVTIYASKLCRANVLQEYVSYVNFLRKRVPQAEFKVL